MADMSCMKGIGGLASAVVEDIELEGDLKRKLESGPSVPCGLKDVDLCLRGFWPGDLVTVASAPSVGRSAFAFQAATNAAMAGAHVMLFSFESDAEAVATRLISSNARVSMSKILGGYVSAGDHAALSDARAQLSKLDLSICDDRSLTLEQLCDMATGYKGDPGKRLVVVDGSELLAGDGRNADLGRVAGRLRLLAGEIGAPVLMTVEVRGKDARRVRRKKSWAGAIMDLAPDVAGVADVVLMIDRSLDEVEAESLYGAPSLNTAELAVAKNRRGWQRSITLAFIADYGRFMDYVDDCYL